MSQSTMGFAVVEFVDDCSVDVVPCNWLSNEDTLCFWPPFRSTQLISAVKKSLVPQPSWKKCTIRVLNLYETYSIARGKLRKAEETSALETEGESESRPQRKRKRLAFEDKATSDDEPVSQRTPGSSVPLPDIPVSLQESSGIHLSVMPDNTHDTLVPLQNLTASSKKHETSVLGSSPSGSSVDLHALARTTDRGFPSKEVELVLSKLAMIEAQQRHQAQLLQQLLTAVRKDPDESCGLPDGVSLPVQNISQLTDLNKTLENANSAKQLTRYMGAIGGKDVAETTRRIMSSIMTNSVARRMNFAGRGGKIGIGDMNILNVVFGAVRRNRLLSNVTRAEVEMTVKLWLRYASDRSGGRHARDKRTTKEVLSDMESD